MVSVRGRLAKLEASSSGGKPLLYTILSHGRPLGTTDLGFIYRPRGFRCGWLHPTPVGERLLPVAAGVAPALRTEYLLGPDPTLHADVLAASDHAEALDLQLRREDGVVIDTTDIAIIDTEYLLSIDGHWEDEEEDFEFTPEQEAEIAELRAHFAEKDLVAAAHKEEDTEFPRYQVQVYLVDPSSIPA